MAKDRKKLQHIHSSIADKQPTPQTLEVGEIAVNNSKDQEFLSIKNTEDKVVRFSSDGQIIDWIERKEVMPYVGYVRGGAGPSATSAETPTKDAYGSYGIQTSDLTGNTSEIIIKLNQVAAEKTTKHNKVNGAKDRYNKDVNPTTDGGVNDGAGFYIDMSRYAMQGANPEFSGITNTCYTNLNGTTKIKGVDGACGNLLEITVNSAKTDIETANTEITSATTVIGTNTATISGNTVLNVSGTTTETKKDNVTEHNLANKSETTDVNLTELVKGNNYRDVNGNYSGTTGGTTTEVKTKAVSETNLDTTSIVRHSGVTEDNKSNVVRTTSGTTTETFKGQVTENNQSGYTVNTTGNVIVNTTGVTTETKVGNVTENHSGTTTDNNKGQVTVNNQNDYTVNTTGNTTFNTTGTTTIQSTGNGSDVIVYAKDDLCETSDDVAAFKGANTTNIGSDCTNTNQTKTLNVRANSADTRVTSAYTSATTATTVIGTSNASATTATLSGNTLVVNEATSISAKTPSTTIGGTNFTLNESNTTINSCGKVEITTDSYSLKQCSASGGSAEFEFCNGYTVKSNAINLQQCGTAGTINITSQTQNINGGNLTINESGNTKIYSTGNTDIESTGTTYVVTSGDTQIVAHGNLLETAGGVVNLISQENSVIIASNGVNHSVDISADGNGGDVRVKAKDTLCMSAGTVAALVGLTKTNIGKNCADGGQTATLNINGTAIYETGTTVDISGSLSANVSGASVNVSGGTINISGGSITEKSTGNTCITADSNLTIGGKLETNIGYNCAGTGIANNTRIYASTAVTINAPRTNITGNTYLSGKTYFNNTCETVDANELSDALCEVIRRGAVTIEKNTSPTDPQLATIYKFYQNGEQITNSAGTPVQIEVSKDQFLKEAVVVKNTSGEWVIRLTWWIYDPDSGTHTTATTDIDASELVHDLTAVNPDDNGTAANHNVKVSSWYDSTSGDMKFSAETTSNMHVGNMYVTGTTSALTVSGTNVNGGTISGTTVKGVSISGTNITASTAIRANNVSANTVSAATGVRANNVSANTISATTFYGKMSKSLTWTGGTFSADTTGYNGSADKVITVPTSISHLPTRGKLTVTHNGLSDTYDPASDKSMTLPHSALTWQYGSVTGASSGSYNTSAEKVVTIPKSLKHLTNDLSNLTIAYGSSSNRTGTSTYNGSAAVGTLYIPNTLSNVSNGVVSDSNAASTTTGQINITKPVSVTGTITASGAIYSSDRNLKENIFDIDSNELEKAGLVSYKTYNFKGENNKIYGIIAQDLQEVGLGELVYSREDGTLAVDYTSFMILELARLRRDNETLLNRMAWLEGRIDELEGKKKD